VRFDAFRQRTTFWLWQVAGCRRGRFIAANQRLQRSEIGLF
jgi:hypothetical protein